MIHVLVGICREVQSDCQHQWCLLFCTNSLQVVLVRKISKKVGSRNDVPSGPQGLTSIDCFQRVLFINTFAFTALLRKALATSCAFSNAAKLSCKCRNISRYTAVFPPRHIPWFATPPSNLCPSLCFLSLLAAPNIIATTTAGGKHALVDERGCRPQDFEHKGGGEGIPVYPTSYAHPAHQQSETQREESHR